MRNIPYSPVESIIKKRNKAVIPEEEWTSLITSYVSKQMTDYQMSAFLMACFLNGLNEKETFALTKAMMNSGMTFRGKGPGPFIDKHSTGGIGDKTSFICAPIAACAGIKVPMIAGRSLGHTGGTVDKIEAIAGLKTTFPPNELQILLEKVGMFLIGQTHEIAPADKRMYALRDVTGTVSSIPLITASILCKKLAEGLDGLVLDVKYGEGAFMQTKKKAERLAKSLMTIAKRFSIDCAVYLTNMNEPLGTHVGNSLEILECVDVLKNKGDPELTRLSLELAAGMIFLGKKASTYKKALEMATHILESGKALQKFSDFLKAQGGEIDFIDRPHQLPLAKEKTVVQARKKGVLQHIKNTDIGKIVIELGGGRKTLNDSIDFGVGLVFHKKIGDAVKKGDPLVTIYHHESQQVLVSGLKEKLETDTLTIAAKKKKEELIYKVFFSKNNKKRTK